MPSLSLFIDEHDVNLLVERLNADPEIAFIVPDDPLDWRRRRPTDHPGFRLPSMFIAIEVGI